MPLFDFDRRFLILSAFAAIPFRAQGDEAKLQKSSYGLPLERWALCHGVTLIPQSNPAEPRCSF
jgi:hypothetical protein